LVTVELNYCSPENENIAAGYKKNFVHLVAENKRYTTLPTSNKNHYMKIEGFHVIIIIPG
jgi:hypothetical protein